MCACVRVCMPMYVYVCLCMYVYVCACMRDSMLAETAVAQLRVRRRMRVNLALQQECVGHVCV